MPEAQIKGDMNFKEFIKIWLTLTKETYIKVLLVAIIIVIVNSLFLTFFLSDSYWNQYTLGTQYEMIFQKTVEDPNYAVTEGEQIILSSYSTISTIILLLNSTFQFILPIFLVMLTILYVMNKATAETSSLSDSVQAPFTKGRFFASIFFCLATSSFISIGLLFFIIPGFLVMIYSFFLFHALIIDDTKNFTPVRLSIDYVKGNFFSVLFACFIGFGIPILLGNQIHNSLGALGLSVEAFRTWLDPEARQYGLIFLYHLSLYGIQAFLYPILPTLSFVLYFKIKNKKIKEMMASKGKNSIEEQSDGDVKIVTVHLRGGQKKFRCPSCGNSLSVGVKKCIQCSKLIKYKIN